MHSGGHAPIASSPFAPAPAAGLVQHQASSDATGPMLGKGSELQRLYNMPPTMGHSGCVNCMVMADGKVYSGGRDESLFVWRAQGTPATVVELVQDCPPIALGSSVTSLLYEPSSKWLFCGLWNGEIRAFCKEPVRDDRLQGHRRSVTSLTVHSSVLISGSNDGTVRLWTVNPQTGSFQCHGQALNNPSGPVACVRVLNGALWVGANNGITCYDLSSLQPRGTIQSTEPVTGMLEFQGYMATAYKNGSVKIFDGSGSEIFNRPPMGEHTSNTAVELMMHPTAKKPMLLCGQQLGYVTAYDLPEFRPRGSFVCKDRSDIKVIVDVKSAGMFLTAGFHGDIMVWQWAGTPASAQGQVTSSPFAPVGGQIGVPQVSNPFGGQGVQLGQIPTDLMMG